MTRAIRVAACAATIAACLPYLVMKALWLAGHPVGAVDAGDAAELLDTRHLVGDAITVGLELAAIGLVLALTCRWGRRVPAIVVLAPVWVGTGLLAPIALGAPLGLLAQAFAGGSPAPAGNGSHGWVYLVADGGFVVQAVGLLVAFLGHVHDRWPGALAARWTRSEHASTRQRAVVTTAASVAGTYAALLVVWSAAGPVWGGPDGFDTAAQRTFLMANGVLVLAGALAAMVLVRTPADLPRAVPLGVPLALAWVGTATTVMSGVTSIALSNHGRVTATMVLSAILAVLSGLLLSRATVRLVAVQGGAVG